MQVQDHKMMIWRGTYLAAMNHGREDAIQAADQAAADLGDAYNRNVFQFNTAPDKPMYKRVAYKT